MNADCLVRSHSLSARMYTSVHPSENSLSWFHSGPLGRSVSNLGMSADKIRSKKKQYQAHHQSATLRDPHLISLDARDDLYNMLPTSVKTSLRAKLKSFAKTLASSIYDAALAAEWSLALTKILEWLAPLAHNMIRWHSERNVEKQCMVPVTSILLVQTLHFANQVKTEAAIIELLMGLNYISRFGREIDGKAFMESAGRRACDGYLLQRDNIIYNV
ncbi:hypothetical protein LOK49_LG05G00870 [Camellia lanceoleosa]|uniref:Uncharacterized protein n=1 Tax=Camellia lanceoleosa TaxID=1840588 RepID=A0ACC0HLC1_9ERIC|nr:hypothetical protein LOK49_LG05G00870 [Camellia lanceoleosa]